MKNLLYILCLLFIACHDQKKAVNEENVQLIGTSDEQVIQEIKAHRIWLHEQEHETVYSRSNVDTEAETLSPLYYLEHYTPQRKSYRVFDLEGYKLNPNPDNLMSYFKEPADKRFYAFTQNKEIKGYMIATFESGSKQWRCQILSDWGKVPDWLPTILENQNTDDYQVLEAGRYLYIFVEKDRLMPYYSAFHRSLTEKDFLQTVQEEVGRIITYWQKREQLTE